MPPFKTTDEIEAGLADVTLSPQVDGVLEAIVLRPVEGERRAVDEAELSPGGGVVGDRWAVDPWPLFDDGTPDPRGQLTLMNARILRLIAHDADAMTLAGDNLIVDFDVGKKNLPVGTRLEIGEALVEINDLKHTGCKKFAERYGQEALKLINDERGKRLGLRGRYATIIRAGKVRVGDRVRKPGIESAASA